MSSANYRGWGLGWPNCQADRIVTVTISNGVRLPVHGDIAVLVKGLCEQTLQRGYELRPGWCWGYACRSIRGSTSPSNHSWGLAVDLNAPTNPMSSTLITDMPPWMPALWKSYGFGWGGDYRTRPDAMHYEFIGTPADARAQTVRLLANAADVIGQATPGDDDVTPADKDELVLRTAAAVLKILTEQGDKVRGLRVAEHLYDKAIVPAGGWPNLIDHFTADADSLAASLAPKLTAALSGAGSKITQSMLEDALRKVLGSLDES